MNPLQIIRKELENLNLQILNNPILKLVEERKLKRDVINYFVINQWYIVNHDLRSLALGLSKSRSIDELSIFKELIDGDYHALGELMKLMKELNIDIKDPLTYNISPKAVNYTHYLSWLANYAEPKEFLFATVVNLPVWGTVVTRFGEGLRRNYGINELGFFDTFKGSYDELENKVISLLEVKDMNRLKTIAYMIQYYEKEFWESLLEFR
ncbi:TenA family transcriptional regulator [Sulfolobus sp. E3]|nr:TenA family transcriptional regulator [Sulfolobus sp. E3]